MNVDEIQQLQAAIAILREHGYPDTAEILVRVLERESALVAQSLHPDEPLPPGIIAARGQRADGINL